MNPSTTNVDLQSVVYILCNACELIGIWAGGAILLSAWLPAACGLRGYWWKFLALSICLILIGLGTNSVMNALTALNSPFSYQIALAAELAIALLIIALALLGFLAPTAIAIREQLNKKTQITLINLGSLIFPPCWIIALVLAGMDMKKKNSEIKSPDVPQA